MSLVKETKFPEVEDFKTSNQFSTLIQHHHIEYFEYNIDSTTVFNQWVATMKPQSSPKLFQYQLQSIILATKMITHVSNSLGYEM